MNREEILEEISKISALINNSEIFRRTGDSVSSISCSLEALARVNRIRLIQGYSSTQSLHESSDNLPSLKGET